MRNEPDDIDIDEIDVIDDQIDDFVKPRRKRRSKEEREEQDKQDYVNKEKMWNALKEYYEASEKDPDMMIPLELATMVNDIGEHMRYRPNFSAYSWMDDMVGDAKVKIFKAVKEKAFKLFKTALIVDITEKADETTIFFWTKKARKDVIAEKTLDADDVIFEKDGQKYITFKSNPFGFYSAIVWNCYINRIKKEKQFQETMANYQTEVYENMYASDVWKNVRRQKIFYDDDGSAESVEE